MPPTSSDYGRDYQRPGLFARFLGVLYRILPKVGPLKPLAFKAPTPEAAELFARSFRDATARFRTEVNDLKDRQFEIANANFDTGRPSRFGDYSLADDTYGELLVQLSDQKFQGMPVALTRNIVAFYGDGPGPSVQDKKVRKRWAKVERTLQELRGLLKPKSLLARRMTGGASLVDYHRPLRCRGRESRSEAGCSCDSCSPYGPQVTLNPVTSLPQSRSRSPFMRR